MGSLLEELYLSGMLASSAFLPFMWPIVSSTMYFWAESSPVLGAAVGTGAFLVGEAVNLLAWFGPPGLASYPEILLSAVGPGFLTALAAWSVSVQYLLPGWPSVCALIAGFAGYEGFIQTCERQSQGPQPSVLKKATFWMFTLVSLAILYLVGV